MNKDLCTDCPRNNVKCKGDNWLIVGCVQCLEARETAIKNKDKPKREFPKKKDDEVQTPEHQIKYGG